MFTPDLGALSSMPPPPEYAWPLLESLPETLTAQERDAIGWTAAISARMDAITGRARMLPGFHHAAVGFLHQSVDIGFERASLPIGVILYTRADLEGWDVLGDRLRSGNMLDPIEFEGFNVSCPVTVRPGLWRENGSYTSRRVTPPTLPGGRLACWVSTRAGACEGWLTAAHAAPALGMVVDTATECTDAAVIAGYRPGVHAAQPAFRYPAYGVGADIELGSGVTHATILDVSVDFDIYRDPKFPVRFSLDSAGQPGDSGSYISRRPGSEPLGLYLGEFLPSTAQSGQASSGYGLAMYQLEHMMKLEAYP